MLIILNDNGMSISKPQGAFSQYLERVRVSTTYEEFKRFGEKIVDELPAGVGHTIEHALARTSSDGVKGAMWPGQIFEALGIKYMGPIDGHDLPGLINFLAEIKHVDKPVLLHVKTVKGHGYEVACNEPTQVPQPRRVPRRGLAAGAERLPGRDQQGQRQVLDDRLRRRHDRPGEERPRGSSP